MRRRPAVSKGQKKHYAQKHEAPQGRARMMLRLNRCARPTCRSTTSRNASVHRPFSVSNEMSTTMLSIRHFSSFTCTPRRAACSRAPVKGYPGPERSLPAQSGILLRQMHAHAQPHLASHSRAWHSTMPV